MREEKKIDGRAGRKVIYTRVLAIWFICCIMLVNDNNGAAFIRRKHQVPHE
jgi:hypothetical protein